LDEQIISKISILGMIE